SDGDLLRTRVNDLAEVLPVVGILIGGEAFLAEPFDETADGVGPRGRLNRLFGFQFLHIYRRGESDRGIQKVCPCSRRRRIAGLSEPGPGRRRARRTECRAYLPATSGRCTTARRSCL